MKRDYYDATIQTYEENGYEQVDPARFPDWEKFLLPYLKPGDHILDLGCGSGVYARRFQQLGYKVCGLDASATLCAYVRRASNIPVRRIRFDELEDRALYDAVFACVSLLHVSRADYPDIFGRVHRALKEKGFFYASFKEGEFEGFREDSRSYFTEMTEELMRDLLAKHGLFSLKTVSRTPFQQTKDQHWIHFIMEKRSHGC